ncbi:MAG: hypothetical protein PUA68_03885 [Bacilli bacterium]|nr:hypothetical protein [Bacilli bacterium]
MKIDLLLEIYVIIILFCLFINLAYISYMDYYKKTLVKRKQYWAKLFNEMINKKRYIIKKNDIYKIHNTTWARAFIETYIETVNEKPQIEKMIDKNKKELLGLLLSVSSKLSKTYKAFFLYFIKVLNVKKDKKIIEIITKEVMNKSLYVRINTISLIISSKDPVLISKIFKELSLKNISINSIILTDLIKNYCGNKKTLANELFVNYEYFIDSYKKVFINLLNITNNHKFDNNLISYFSKEEKNIKLLIIDLVSKKETKTSKKFIIDLLKNEDDKIVETVALSITKFSDVKIKEELFVLSKHPNYNIKNNSIKSLIELNVVYDEFKNKVDDDLSREIFKNNFEYIKGVK